METSKGNNNREEAINILSSIKKPILLEESQWKFGIDYTVITSKGRYVKSSNDFLPLSVASYSKERKNEIFNILESLGIDLSTFQSEIKEQEGDYCFDIEENVELEKYELVLIYHDSEPEKTFWICCDYAEQVVGDCRLYDNKEEAIDDLIESIIEYGETSFELWEEIDDSDLFDIVEEVSK